MKNLLLNTILLGLFLIAGMKLQAQPPVKFNYQGIARAADGNPLVNQALGFRISIIDGSAAGTVQFVETHTATTNSSGLYTLTIGAGTAVTGTIMSPTWPGTGTFIKVEIDPAGGAAYVDAGTTELKYVPYSIMSNFSVAADQARRLTLFGSADNVLTHNGTGWTAAPGPWVKTGTVLSMNNAGLGVNQVYVGSSAGSPSSFMDVVDGTAGRSTLTANQINTTGTAFQAAVKGVNFATDANGYGVYGLHNGTGSGVYGESNTTSAGGIGVKGTCSGSGAGVLGSAAAGTAGNGVYGSADQGSGVFGGANSGTGVDGTSTSAAGVRGRGNTGVWAEANTTANAVALRVDGHVKAVGTNKFAYRTGETTVAVGEFTLTHGNQAATDIIMVTPVHTSNSLTGFPGYYLHWNSTAWKIYNASDDGTPLLFPIGTSFNVIVIRL